jgi:hypothetical protein
MVEPRIAAQIAGLTDYRTDEPLDRPPTAEERDLAVEVGYEIAAQHGIDLAALVTAHQKQIRQWDAEQKREE